MNLFRFICSCCFTVDDERVTEQGQSNCAVGRWIEQEACCLFCLSKGLFEKGMHMIVNTDTP